MAELNKKMVVLINDEKDKVQGVNLNTYHQVDLNTLNKAYKESDKGFYVVTDSEYKDKEQAKTYFQNFGLNIVLAAIQSKNDYLAVILDNDLSNKYFPLNSNQIRNEISFACKNDFSAEIIVNDSLDVDALKNLIEEKTDGIYLKDKMIVLNESDLVDVNAIVEALSQSSHFNKVIVHTSKEDLLNNFLQALTLCIQKGNYYIIQSNDAFVKVLYNKDH